MSLDKNKIKGEMYNAFYSSLNTFVQTMKAFKGDWKTEDPVAGAIAAASEVFSKAASDSIDAYIKSATIVVPLGTKVEVDPQSTGSASILTGATSLSGGTTYTTPSEVANIIDKFIYKGTVIEDTVPAKIS